MKLKDLKKDSVGFLVAFIVTGVLVDKPLFTDNLVHIFLYITIWVTGIYSILLGMFAEKIWGKDIKEKNTSNFIILIFQTLCLELLWFLFEKKFNYYAGDLCVLNLSYIYWDFIHRKRISRRIIGLIIGIFDLFGLLISVLLFLNSTTLPSYRIDSIDLAHSAIWIVLFSGVLIYHSITGLFIFLPVAFKSKPVYSREKKPITPEAQPG